MSELSPLRDPAGPASQIGGRETASLCGTCLVSSAMENRGRREWKERNWTEIEKKPEKNSWGIPSF